MCTPDIFLGLLAILFPPLPVWVKCGICSADSIINILLCVLGYIPGLLHAWYIIAKIPDEYGYESVPQDGESGRVTYVFVHGNGAQSQQQQQQQPKPDSQPRPQGGMNYGSTDGNSSTAAQAGSAEGSSSGNQRPPPTYAEAVQGDHKVQSQE